MLVDAWIRTRQWWCGQRHGHDYFNWTPPSCTPLVVCRRCGHGGWVL